jgi:DNA phosphorothioation system restriction enzyme
MMDCVVVGLLWWRFRQSRPVLTSMNELRLDSVRGTYSTLGDGFYRKEIQNATEYRRAAGYFSSSIFSVAWSEFQGFFNRGGQIEVVANNQFSGRDIQAILSGLQNPRHWLGMSVKQLPVSECSSGGAMLSWAVAHGQLRIKVASVKHSEKSIYHEKFGVFLSHQEPLLAFEGSANETRAGMNNNFERVVLFRKDSGHGALNQRRLLAEFEALWHNRTDGLSVISIQQAFREGLIIKIDDPSEVPYAQVIVERSKVTTGMSVAPEILQLPDRLILHDYQQEAIESWFENDGQGILEMATGAGKTITALACLTKLYQLVGGPLVIIIVAPYIHLVDQWADEASGFGLAPIRCYGKRDDWLRFFESGIFLTNSGKREILSVVATNTTFCTDIFASMLNRIKCRAVVVADEVHNLGAPKLAAFLPKRIPLRLGLSATPTRWRDADGTDLLSSYFGKVILEFGLREALSHIPPVLVPYRYFPIIVELDDDEQEEYVELTLAIGRSMSAFEVSSISEPLKKLLIKRSRLIAGARQKLPKLKEVIYPYRESTHSLIYCGDSNVEFGESLDAKIDDFESRRQIDLVTEILGNELNMVVTQFTANTPKVEREIILSQFASGELQAIVAIRCLDEGVNIPQIQRAFILASSTNPRQFIQRRGRILRRSAGKESAEIFDFVVRPPSLANVDGAAFRAGRGIIQNEMRRVVEFASLAENGSEARASLLPILIEWDLLHI